MSTVPAESSRAGGVPVAAGDIRPSNSPPAPSLTIVVPTYSERDNVGSLFAAPADALRDIPFEVIFVDDNSPDGTSDEVRALARRDTRCRLINRSERRGLSAATLEGMLSALSPVVAIIDGNLQHDETALPAMKAKIDSGDADIVVATRYASGRTENGLIGSRRALRSSADVFGWIVTALPRVGMQIPFWASIKSSQPMPHRAAGGIRSAPPARP
jgi:glycosyltransferase involved in cell wall biosynthesis